MDHSVVFVYSIHYKMPYDESYFNFFEYSKLTFSPDAYIPLYICFHYMII